MSSSLISCVTFVTDRTCGCFVAEQQRRFGKRTEQENDRHRPAMVRSGFDGAFHARGAHALRNETSRAQIDAPRAKRAGTIDDQEHRYALVPVGAARPAAGIIAAGAVIFPCAFAVVAVE
jgi:hypothetical protein